MLSIFKSVTLEMHSNILNSLSAPSLHVTWSISSQLTLSQEVFRDHFELNIVNL